MPELRYDTLSGRTVLVAPERAARPHTSVVAPTPPPERGEDCPFCAGNEHETPPEVARTGPGEPDTPGWRVRVVPNKYSLVGGAVRGAHDVVILSPAHDRDLRTLEPRAAREALRLVRDRAAHHLRGGLAFALAFVNHGRAAGASLEHPHAQLVALGFVPPAPADEAARFARAGRDLVAASLAEARDRGLVLVDGPAAAWSPWAAATPYETIVAHPDAASDFAAASDEHVDAVTDAFRDVLGRIARTLGAVPYNVVFHGAPGGHWYARVTVRVFTHAGFEMGTGVLANTVPGEVAAARLRE